MKRTINEKLHSPLEKEQKLFALIAMHSVHRPSNKIRIGTCTDIHADFARGTTFNVSIFGLSND